MRAYHKAILLCEKPKKELIVLLADAKRSYCAAYPKRKLLTDHPEEISFDLPVNRFSWGERLTISIEGGYFRIFSICRLPFHGYICGKNRLNVLEFRSLLYDIINDSESHQRLEAISNRTPGPAVNASRQFRV